VDVSDTLEICFSTPALPCQIQSSSAKPCDFISSRPARSPKDSGTDTDQLAIFEFLLMFHSNYEPISYPFPDKGQYLRNFPTARTLQLREFPLEFCNGGGRRGSFQNTRPFTQMLPCVTWAFCVKWCRQRQRKKKLQNMGALWLRPFGRGVGDPYKQAPHICYHIKFGSSASKAYAEIEGKLQNW